MTKNLKKVISAVAALAISASAVSAFAVNFPDVAEDASYAEAVQELSSLDIISGFEDGTFRPDELVTRAQITKMIVDALNERAQAEASKANSQFNDVSTDHWAKGYINQGVADKFIAGYSSTEFGPDDNVTYVQAQKMLVSAIGYETYAQGNGGWPNGYKQWAASTGITDGISGLNDDTQLTRAQVAQLIDNAMDAPVCVIDSWEPQWNGTQTPVLKIKNTHNGDDAKDYQTLFTLKHKAYKVYGRVEKTSKSSGGTVDTDKVNFTVEKAENFDDIYYRTTGNNSNTYNDDMYYGDTNAVDLLLVYSNALIQKNSDDEFTILSITPVASTKTVTLAAEDFDDSKSDNTSNNLYFYPAGTTRNSQKYSVATSYEVYVNGVKDNSLSTWAALTAYIEANDTSSVTLEKKSNTGTSTTSSDYNLIKIATYKTAIVSDVVEKTDEIRVNFDSYETGLATRLVVDLDDDTKTYSFKLDGVEIEPTALEEDDVLSIAYDNSADTTFANSSFYDVLVSRDVVEGKVTNESTGTDKEYTVDGTKYKTVSGLNPVVEVGNTYTLYLDHFGRIAKSDENTDSKKLGILKNVYKKAGGDWYAQIITKEGAEEEHKIDDKNVTTYGKYVKADFTTADTDGVTYDNTHTKLDNYPKQVIDYTVSSTSDKITIKSNYTTPDADETDTEYKEASNKIGSVRFGSGTVILDISEVNNKDEYKVVDASSLVNDNKYSAAGYDKTKSGDSYYRFVLLLSGASEFNSDNPLAIYNGSELVTVDDDDKTAFNLIVPGEEGPEEVQYIVDDDLLADLPELYEGDAVVFTTNSAGEIAKLESVFKVTPATQNTAAYVKALDTKTYDSFKNTVLAAGTLTDAVLGTPVNSGTKNTWNKLLNGSSEDIEMYFGVAVNKRGSQITVVDKVAAGTVNGENYNYVAEYEGTNAHELNTSGATVYTYVFSANSKNSKVMLDDGVQVTPESSKALDKTGKVNKLALDNSDISDEVVFALVRADGDDAKEIYFIVNED